MSTVAETGQPSSARLVYKVLEAIHNQVYFAPEPTAEYLAYGLKGRAGYFASRAAPMGAVPGQVVTATFFVFAPALVERAIPMAWGKASPPEIVASRFRGVDASLRRILGPAVDGPEVAEAAEIVREACATLRAEGRPLYAGHASLDWPTVPHLVLWHGATLLREHRGDGHIAALLTAGLDAVEALVTYHASGGGSQEFLQAGRGWSDEEWASAGRRLRDRGLLAEDGSLTEAGTLQRTLIEAQTDQSAQGPWDVLGVEAAVRLRELLRPLAKTILGSGIYPASVLSPPKA